MTDQPLIVGPRGEVPERPDISETPSNVLQAILQAAADPRMDVQKLERLLDLQQRVMADQRETAFKAALARLQAKLPMIEKGRPVISKGVERYRYANREDIHKAIQPLLAAEGFALSFNEEPVPGQALRRFSATLSHRDGHSETKYKTMPLDESEYRTKAQTEGSTATYAQRYLIKMHLNIVEKDEDDDGRGGSPPISTDDVLNLLALIEETQTNTEKFLAYMHVAKLEDILTCDFKKAVTMLETKRRRQREQ